ASGRIGTIVVVHAPAHGDGTVVRSGGDGKGAVSAPRVDDGDGPVDGDRGVIDVRCDLVVMGSSARTEDTDSQWTDRDRRPLPENIVFLRLGTRILDEDALSRKRPRGAAAGFRVIQRDSRARVAGYNGDQAGDRELARPLCKDDVIAGARRRRVRLVD